jgi:hypothetical protein
MDNTKKAAIGATFLLLAIVGGRVWMIHKERTAPIVEKPKVAETKIDEDDLVFLKHKRPSTPADLKELVGTTIWVSAGGQMDYYPASGKHADYSKTAGTLLGADPVAVKGYFEQVAPAISRSRIPRGDRHVLLLFTLPKSDSPAKEYAVPVGYHDNSGYSFLTDEIFFYDDPHELYKHWGPEVWKAVDEHRVILGMSEREVQMALGQVSESLSNDYGNRLVRYNNLGHPFDVTFVKNKVTSFKPHSD